MVTSINTTTDLKSAEAFAAIPLKTDGDKRVLPGVSMRDLGSTLATLLAEAKINRFIIEGRSHKVIAQVERPYRNN